MGRNYRGGSGAQSTGANNVPLANPRSWVSTAPAPGAAPKAPMRPAPAPRRPVGRGAGNNIPEWMKKGVTAAAPSLPSSTPAAPVDPSAAAAARAPVANPLAGFQAGGGQQPQQQRRQPQQQSQGGYSGGRQSYGGQQQQQQQQSQGGYSGGRQSYGGQQQQQQSFGGQQSSSRGNSTRDAPAPNWPPAGLSGTLMSGQLPAGVDAVVEAKELTPMVSMSAPASTPASFGRVKTLRAQGMANADIAKLRVQAISMLLSGGGMMQQQQSYGGGYQQPQMQMQAQPMGGYQQQPQAVAPGGFPGAGAPGGFPGASSGPGGFQR